jgi:hypothetical protein
VTFIVFFSFFKKGTWFPHNRRFSVRFLNKTLHEFYTKHFTSSQ